MQINLLLLKLATKKSVESLSFDNPLKDICLIVLSWYILYAYFSITEDDF